MDIEIDKNEYVLMMLILSTRSKKLPTWQLLLLLFPTLFTYRMYRRNRICDS